MRLWKPEELETVACDHCGALETSDVYTRVDGMKVVECAVCGLAYLNPRPLAHLIPLFYEADYFTGAALKRGEGGLEVSTAPTVDQNTISQPLPRKIALVQEMFGGFARKKVLEIGCASGESLLIAQNLADEVQGLEISDFAAEIARKRGLNVTTGVVEDFAPYNREKFDVIFAFEVIEHVLSPSSFLSQVSSMLKPNGIFLLSTPNYECAFSLRDRWQGFTNSFEHLYFFSVPQLKRMAARQSLSLAYYESELPLVLKSRPESPVQHWIRKLKILSASFSVREIVMNSQLRKFPYVPHGNNHAVTVAFVKG